MSRDRSGHGGAHRLGAAVLAVAASTGAAVALLAPRGGSAITAPASVRLAGAAIPAIPPTPRPTPGPASTATPTPAPNPADRPPPAIP